MNNLFKIGEIAKLFHINIRTLRYYDDIDLLKPEHVDRESGYRYYSIAQFEQLNTIRYLRELKVPLKEIKDFLTYRELHKVKRILKKQVAEVEEKQRELEIVKRKIQSRIGQIEAAEIGRKDQAEIVRLPERKAVLIKQDMLPDSNLEYPIRLLEKNAKQATIFLGKVGLSIEKKKILQGQFTKYDCIFLLLDPGEDYEGETISVPAGDFGIIRFTGTHQQAEGSYERLMEYIGRRGYEITGDSMEITVIDYGFTGDQSQFVTEIQVPLSKKLK